ncbi:hypothetical protein pb186bvf_008373 [Paramecium bursaria]
MDQLNYIDVLRKASKVQISDKITTVRQQLQEWYEVQINNLKQQYQDQTQALQDLNLQLQQNVKFQQVKILNLTAMIAEQEQLLNMHNLNLIKIEQFRLLQNKIKLLLQILKEEGIMNDYQVDLYQNDSFDVAKNQIVYQRIQKQHSIRTQPQTNVSLMGQTQRVITKENKIQARPKQKKAQSLKKNTIVQSEKRMDNSKEKFQLLISRIKALEQQNHSLINQEPKLITQTIVQEPKTIYRFLQFDDLPYKNIFNKAKNFDVLQSSRASFSSYQRTKRPANTLTNSFS